MKYDCGLELLNIIIVACDLPELLRVVAPGACAGGAELSGGKAVAIQLQAPGLLAVAFLPAPSKHSAITE